MSKTLVSLLVSRLLAKLVFCNRIWMEEYLRKDSAPKKSVRRFVIPAQTPLKGMYQLIKVTLFYGKKEVGNPHMHTLLKMLERFRSAVEVGFLFCVGSFYQFYVNKEIAENIFKWIFKPIR